MAFMEVKHDVWSNGKRVMTAEKSKRWLTTSFDTNGDGRISKAELRLTGGHLGSRKSERAFKSAGANHDSFIDANEFRNLAHIADKHFNVRSIR